MRAAGMRPATIATRARHIRRLARTVGAPPQALTPTTLLEWGRPPKMGAGDPPRLLRLHQRVLRRMGAEPSPAAVLPSISRPTPPSRPTPENVFAAALERDERTSAIP